MASGRAARIGLLLATALSGAAVMIVELSLPRSLAPHFGATPMIWTNVLAVVLLALALGYAVGGRISESKPSPKRIGALLAMASAAIFSLPSLVFALTRTLASEPVPVKDFVPDSSPEWRSLLVISLTFGPPVVLMGMTTPYLTRCLVDLGVEAPRASSAMLASSTLGSIVGTYLPAYVLLDHLGVRWSIWVGALALGTAAMILFTIPSRSHPASEPPALGLNRQKSS